jgi:hypothetical protein
MLPISYPDYTPTLGGASHESPPAEDWLAALLVGSQDSPEFLPPTSIWYYKSILSRNATVDRV